MNVRIFIDVDENGILQIAGWKDDIGNGTVMFKIMEATRYEVQVVLPHSTDPIQITSIVSEHKEPA